MIFNQLFDDKSSTYTYIIASDRGREALIIDPVIEKTDKYLKILKDLDVIRAKNMTTEAVLVKSMCLLGVKSEFLNFKNDFERPFSGEIS